MDKVEISICFHLEFFSLLPRDLRHAIKNRLVYDVGRRTSIKDLVESFCIPHTEIGELVVNDHKVDFSYLVKAGDRIRVVPPIPPVDPCSSSLLRPHPLPHLRFLVDVNVAKLRAYLRMAGFDTLYQPDLKDSEIARMAAAEGCVLLSRDRGLLRRKIIEHGHLVRSQQPVEQLAEIIRYYDLARMINPFSRCMHCNTTLEKVEKQHILHRLEPLTKLYYTIYSHCPGCARVYWAGSHRSAMEQTLEQAVKISTA